MSKTFKLPEGRSSPGLMLRSWVHKEMQFTGGEKCSNRAERCMTQKDKEFDVVKYPYVGRKEMMIIISQAPGGIGLLK